MNLTIKLRRELATAVLRDQFGGEIDDLKASISKAVNDKCSKDDGGCSEKIINLAKDGGVIDRLGLTQSVFVDGVSKVKFVGSSDSGCEYSVNETFSLERKYISRYTFYVEADDKIKKLFNDLNDLKSKWNSTKSDLISVLLSVKTVKKLKDLTNVFDPFIPTQTKGMQLIPAEQLLRINELKSPKTPN